MAEKRKPIKLTLQQWLVCYVASVSGGAFVWYSTGNPWLGGGVLVFITAFYVFYLSGKANKAQVPDEVEPAGLSRQQKRALERKKNK
jgi:hypothetical protein